MSRRKKPAAQIAFRADPELIAALQACADQQGVTLSELLRRGAQMALVDSATAPDAPQGYAFLTSAAKGDLTALRALAALGLQIHEETGDVISLIEGLAFARLAAAAGELYDASVLGKTLLACSVVADSDPNAKGWASNLNVELVALSARFADLGIANAEVIADRAIASLTTDEVANVKEIAAIMPLGAGAK